MIVFCIVFTYPSLTHAPSEKRNRLGKKLTISNPFFCRPSGGGGEPLISAEGRKIVITSGNTPPSILRKRVDGFKYFRKRDKKE